jgi:kinase-associated protein B
LNIGDRVVAPYKSGVYVGELIQLERSKAKVRMLAVMKHPTQGDLHNPMQADVAMFHERRALAYREVANVFASEVQPYEGDTVPDYGDSLKEALEAEIEAMKRLNNAFGQRCVVELQRLAADYFKS